MLTLTSCGPQRKNPVAKAYHNTTSYFNWYYNAELAWREGVRDIDNAFRIPAEGYIPLLYYGDENSAKGAFPKFDESIKKCEVVIFKHPNAKWIDNCRYLIGRNWFYKKNYYLAAQNLEYVLEKFPKTKITTDVNLWLVRTYLMLDRESTAEKIIKEKLKGKLKKRQKGELAMMEAHNQVKTGELDKAVKTLEKNLRYIHGKTNRARVYFLLGQLQADNKKLAKAYDYFRKVTRMNTDYELIFNAKIRTVRLLVEQQEGTDETSRIYHSLKRMLRDEKNVDFKDQLYYEMAKLDIKKENYDAALKNLNLSISSSTSNPRQKALSYFQAGKIYFYQQNDLLNAQAYFDSASTTITRNDPEYKEITALGETLDDYVKFRKTIQYQDSMLALSRLSKEELDKRVDMVIAEEQRRKEMEQMQMQQQMNAWVDPNQADPFAPKPGNSGTGFYFTNPDQVSGGRMEFQRLWGQRKNEDNWRRRNKELTFAEEKEEKEEVVDSAIVKKYGKKYKYYKDIPQSNEERQWANDKIMESLFGLGQLFDKKLNMPDSAAVWYDRLITRYSDTEYGIKGRFALYHIYSKKDPYVADEYKEWICNKQPEGMYCKLLKNEDISEELYAAANELKSAYTALYMTFKSEDYQTVVSFSSFLLSKFTEGDELPQVWYMRGKAFGELNEKDSLRSNFQYLVKTFPKSDVAPIAQRTLDLMDNKPGNHAQNPQPQQQQLNGGDNKGEASPDDPRFKDFVKDPKSNEKFMVVALVDKEYIPSNELKVKYSTFNDAVFSNEKLQVSIFFYQNKQHLVYISQFNSASEAMNYVNIAKKDDNIMPTLASPTHRILFITPTNFRIAYGKQRFADYFEFYDKMILPSLGN